MCGFLNLLTSRKRLDLASFIMKTSKSLTTTYEYARFYLSQDLSVIPIKYKEKYPAIKSWKEYQTRKPTEKELH